MKKLIALVCLLPMLGLSAQIDLKFDLTDFALNPATNRTVWVTAMSVPTAGSASVVIGSKMISTTDNSGIFYISNVIANLYSCSVQAPPSRTDFMVLIQSTDSGLINAHSNLVAASTATFPAGSVAWSAASQNLRFAAAGTVGGGSFSGNTNQFTTNSTTSIKSGSQQTNNQFYTSGGSGNITFTDSTMAVMALFSSLNGLFFPGTSFFNQSGYTNGAGLTTISITGVDGNVVASNFVSRAGGRFTGSAGGLTNLGIIAGTNTVAYTNVVTGIVTIDSVTNPVFNNVDIGGTFFNSAGVINLNTSSGGILWGPGFGINQNGNIVASNFVNVAGGKFIGDGGSVTNLSITNMDNPTFLAMAKGMESGNTFSNINRYIWTNWYAKLRLTTTTTQQITIAAVVDGLGSIGLMTKTGLSPTNFGLPVVGYMNGIFPQWVGFVAGNAVQGGEHDGLWYPGGWFNLPGQNDAVTFKDSNAVGPLANAVTVYYVKEPGAGHIKVETNINGGSFGVANASIDAANATFDAGIFSVTNTLGLGNVQVKITEIDSGKSVKILYPKIWNTKSNGIIFATFQGSGSDVPANILTTNLLFSGKVWNDINPTLILDSRVTFTDDGGATIGATYTNILAWYRFCKTNFATTDIVLAGEYPNGDTSGINTLDEYIVRTNAQYYGFGYFDGWSPFVSKENFFKRGWAASLGNVHATAAGVVAYESVLIHWLDLFWGGSIGGGSQTPWASLIDGGGNALSNVGPISVSAETNSSWTANTLLQADANKGSKSLANGGANTVVHGTTPPTETAVIEADQSLSDVTTANVSTTKHGYAPKAPNDATKYLDGLGAYSVPPGSGSSGTAWLTNGNTGTINNSDFLGTTDNTDINIFEGGSSFTFFSGIRANIVAHSSHSSNFGGNILLGVNDGCSILSGAANIIGSSSTATILGSSDSISNSSGGCLTAGSSLLMDTKGRTGIVSSRPSIALGYNWTIQDAGVLVFGDKQQPAQGTFLTQTWIDDAVYLRAQNGTYQISGGINIGSTNKPDAGSGIFTNWIVIGATNRYATTNIFEVDWTNGQALNINKTNGVVTIGAALNGNGNPATNFGTISGTQLLISGGPNWVGQTYMTNQLTATNTDSTKVPFTIGMNGIGTNVWEVRTNGVLMGYITNGTLYMPSFSGSNATFTGSTAAGCTNLYLNFGTTNSIVMVDTNGTTTTRIYSQSGTLYSSASPPQRTVSVDEYSVISGTTTALIDGKTTGATTLYTVPAGRQFILQHAYVIPTTVTSLTTPSTVSIGKTSSTYIDVIASTALTGLVGANTSINLAPIIGASVLQAGDVLKVNVSVAAIGTAYTFSVVVTGILL